MYALAQQQGGGSVVGAGGDAGVGKVRPPPLPLERPETGESLHRTSIASDDDDDNDGASSERRMRELQQELQEVEEMRRQRVGVPMEGTPRIPPNSVASVSEKVLVLVLILVLVLVLSYSYSCWDSCSYSYSYSHSNLYVYAPPCAAPVTESTSTTVRSFIGDSVVECAHCTCT